MKKTRSSTYGAGIRSGRSPLLPTLGIGAIASAMDIWTDYSAPAICLCAVFLTLGVALCCQVCSYRRSAKIGRRLSEEFAESVSSTGAALPNSIRRTEEI